MAKVHPDQWVFIYGLRDPRNLAMMYIGSSVNPPKRLSEHITDAVYYGDQSPRCKWIKQLHRDGYRPVIALLSRVKARYRDECEAWFIEYYDNTTNLLNVRKPCSQDRLKHQSSRIMIPGQSDNEGVA